MMKSLIIVFAFLITLLPNVTWATELECTTSETLSESLRHGQSVVVAVSQKEILNAAWSCTKNFFMGVWDATGGAAKDAWDCVTSPIDCAQSAVQGVKNAWNFLKDLSSNLGQMWENLSSLTPQQKVDIVCELVGSIGSSVAIGILTAGAASALAARTIVMLTTKVAKIAKVLKRIRGITPRKLARLADDVLEKAEEMASLGYERYIKRAVEACPL